ncbi:MAG: helix-turn-helix transcriptional regulator [Phaeodactylibacter sp.]|nr:helix-turn-helix transcriptional regulator [Phaeodactylibacter sp.]
MNNTKQNPAFPEPAQKMTGIRTSASLLPNNLQLQRHAGEASSRDHVFLESVRASILRNLDQKGFGVEGLAGKVHLSVSQLNRRLKVLLGRPAGQLIRELRLRHSARLLALDAGSIGDIAHQAGFSDQAHFCRSFKKLFRCTPSDYRDQHHHLDVADFFSGTHARNGQKDARNVQAGPF